MIRIDPPDRDLPRGLGASKFNSNGFRGDRVARQSVVSEKNSRSPVATNNPCVHGRMRSFDRHYFSTKRVQQFEGAIGGLRNAVNVEQAEAAVKRHRRKIIFLEDIGKSPVAIALN